MPEQTTQTNQGYMQQPPFVITTKDHLYLEDMLSWNLCAAKKAHFFSEQVQDQEIKNAMHEMGTMHQRHYQMLLNHIGQHMQQGAGAMTRGGMPS
ncbi:hypothetical protein ACFO4N_06730 [Camelliibacillus cellulosilyticus]|uniref:Coat F domain-containing protein n=1 Tax=Camelliibacillus cellulosilyticus TaxID=2174486 RepID=A0ABV9GM98_9BACL